MPRAASARAGVGSVLAVVLAASLLLAGGTPAAAAPSEPTPPVTFTTAPETPSPYQGQVSCDPVEKPGAAALRSLLKATYGKANSGGTVRSCSAGGTSEHKEGRAYDWMLNAYDAADRAKGDAFVAWLTGRDAAGVPGGNAHRLGVQYVIWNKRTWQAWTGAWKTYTGASPHTDHVHISLSWDGAFKRTSWWTGKAVTRRDFGPCVVYVGEPAPAYTKPNYERCPPSVRRTDGPVASPRPPVGDVFAYSSTFGSHGVLAVGQDGDDRGLAVGSSEPGWDMVVPVEIDGTDGDELLFYNPAEGRRKLVDVTSSGELRLMSSGGWSKNWDVLVPVETDGTKGDELLVYNSVNGRRWILDVSRTGTTSALQGGGWSLGWDVVVPVETDGTGGSELVTYNSTNGRRWLLDLSRTGGTQAISGGKWSLGWDVVTGVSRPGADTESLLFYNSRNGRELVLEIGSTGSLKQLSSTTTAAGWTRVVPLALAATGGDAVLHYRGSDGAVAMSSLSSRGVLGGAVTSTWPAGHDVELPVQVPGRT